MMKVNKNLSGNKLTLSIVGRIDAKTAPELEAIFNDLPAEVKALDVDFTDVIYISSAGLRAMLLGSQIIEDRNGSMKIINANDAVMEIFEVTGFTELLPIA